MQGSSRVDPALEEAQAVCLVRPPVPLLLAPVSLWLIARNDLLMMPQEMPQDLEIGDLVPSGLRQIIEEIGTDHVVVAGEIVFLEARLERPESRSDLLGRRLEAL